MTAIGTLLRGPARPVIPDPSAPRDEARATDLDLLPAPPTDGVPDPLSDPPPGPRGGSWFTRPTVILPLVAAMIAAAIVVAFAESGTRGPGVGEAIVTVHGSAFVDRADGTSETVTESTRLHPGDRIDIRRGRAEFELAEGVRFEGLARSTRVADTSLEMARVPTLRSGRLLVASPAGTSLHTGIADVRVEPAGVARIARSYAVTLGSYRGSAVLSSAGIARSVPALRSVVAAATGEIGRVRPIDQRGDRWDRRYLADAVSLDSQLAPLARGMRVGKVDPRSLLATVRGVLDRSPSAAAVARLVKGRPNRLDLGIALAVIGNGTRTTFAERGARALAFRDAGASWGLVAMDVRADPDAVAATMRDALDSKVLSTTDGRTFADQGGLDGIGSGASGSGGASDASGATADGSSGSDGSGTPGADGTGGTGGLPGEPGVTVPGGVPGVTTPGVTVPGGVPGVTPGVTVPGVTTPAIPAIPIIPPVTTPSIPSIPVVTTIVDTVGGVLGGLLPGITTTTTRPGGTTTTTRPLLGGLLPGLGL
ncbi:MAG: hypothetical protein JWM89_2342 [Acidimicrobiales bacterium]|nr:hypothetical protein [Acidimicrobiales bacterium]